MSANIVKAVLLWDLESLMAFDTNRNGLLDAGDERFAQFMVCSDKNHDGVSQSKELSSLGEAGYESISFEIIGRTPVVSGAAGNQITGRSKVTMRDGSQVEAFDVALAF